eukprot:3258500-Rhodomonas_salina.3
MLTLAPVSPYRMPMLSPVSPYCMPMLSLVCPYCTLTISPVSPYCMVPVLSERMEKLVYGVADARYCVCGTELAQATVPVAY